MAPDIPELWLPKLNAFPELGVVPPKPAPNAGFGVLLLSTPVVAGAAGFPNAKPGVLDGCDAPAVA